MWEKCCIIMHNAPEFRTSTGVTLANKSTDTYLFKWLCRSISMKTHPYTYVYVCILKLSITWVFYILHLFCISTTLVGHVWDTMSSTLGIIFMHTRLVYSTAQHRYNTCTEVYFLKIIFTYSTQQKCCTARLCNMMWKFSNHMWITSYHIWCDVII